MNNAAILRDKTIKKMSPDEWRSVIDVNLTGVFNARSQVVEEMTGRRWGRIVNISSVIHGGRLSALSKDKSPIEDASGNIRLCRHIREGTGKAIVNSNSSPRFFVLFPFSSLLCHFGTFSLSFRRVYETI